MMLFVQNVGAQEKVSSSNYARLYVGVVEPQYQLLTWRHIPYYKDNPDSYVGRISYHGVVYDNVRLRYDQLRQRVAVLAPVALYYCLPEKEYIDWFEMDDHRYVMEVLMAFAFIIASGRCVMVRMLSEARSL